MYEPLGTAARFHCNAVTRELAVQYAEFLHNVYEPRVSPTLIARFLAL